MDKHGRNKVQNKKLPITDIKVDTSIVARRSLLPLIKGYYQESALPAWQQTAYPLASIYYALNADTDPTRRIGDFIENSAVRPHFKPPTLHCDPYSEEEARIRYLETKPVCYIVFGKPGLDVERLAESIAIERNCVLISASKILRDIEENGDLRKRNKFECGCDSREDIAWDIVLDRVDKRDILHKGYVLEGLPITQSCKPSIVSASSESVGENDNYLLIALQTESTASEETVITREAADSQKSTSSSELSVQSTSVKSLCSMLSNNNNTDLLGISTLASESSMKSSETCACSNQASDVTKCSSTVAASIQLEEIFNNWHLKPNVIIHVSCPDDEILEKHNARDSNSESSAEQIERESDSLSELSDMLSNKLSNNANSETQFGNPTERLIDELRNYEENCAKSIEKVISSHNPQNVIRIDGRYSFDHCFQSIKIRLEFLPLRAVIIPRRMSELASNFGSGDDETESENESEDYEHESFENFEDENLNLKRVFDEIKRSGIPSAKFQWKLSRWKFLCPVELAKGRKIEGRKKLAARFMNWVFFLSSNDAMEAFIENPRPYLLPPNPRAYCRITVIGPRFSRKTRLCFDLARNLDSVVINLRDIIARLTQETTGSFDTSELVSAIVESTENLPEQDCGDFSRNRGWILDGLPLDFELCKKLLENDVHIDSVIVLFESEPYSKSMEAFFKVQDESSEQSVSEESCESSIEETSQNHSGKSFSLSQYEEQLKYFENNRKFFANKLSHIGVDVILCDLQKIDDVSDHIISQVRKDYQFTVRRLDEKDDDYLDDDDEENQVEGSSTETNGTTSSLSSQQDNNLLLGDCNVFCPIALIEHKVLWKGKEKYRCLLDDKLFFMSSESSLHNFVNDYTKLQLPLSKPFSHIPPLRIFIVGPPGSGKSTLAKSISREYGLAHIDFYKRLEEYALSRGIDVKHLKSKYANQYEEENSSEDSFEEVESPENFDDSKYDTGKATISSFFIKYKKEGTALPRAVANECILNFFKTPFDQCGIVVDSFPNCIEDCEMMLKLFAIPDVIVELECSYVDSEERSLKSMMVEWKLEQETKRNEEETRFSDLMKNYLDKKDEWTRQEKLRRYKERKLDLEEHESSLSDNSSADLPESLSSSYTSDFTSVITTEDEIEIEETFYKLYPEPEPLDDWESEESANQKFAMQIEADFERSSQNLIFMANFFKDENIPWIKVDASPKANKVFIKTSLILSPHIQRNASLLEITHELDNLTAENLLSSGYFFLSSFGRFCPVQSFNGTNPFQMFVPLASKGQIFTVLHRQYVYFLSGEAALLEFKKDPLKYLIGQDSQHPMIPALISIIGPPKCGKSTLANRFASTYSFEVVSCHEAINYVLDNFAATNLSSSIRKNFQNGDTATPCQLAAAIKLFLSNPKCVTQGCVFDGFPASSEEAQALASLAIIPAVVVDLKAPFKFTFECIEHDPNHVYSSPSHFQDFESWKTDAQEYRTWLAEQYGNVVKVDATRSKAAVWRRADEHVRYMFGKFFDYVREVGYEKVHDLESLCVTPRAIQNRTSRFQLYCPGCAYFDETFLSPNLSKSRKGLLQFREHFYWFCDRHSTAFVQAPHRHLRLFEKLDLPDTHPEILAHDVVDLENSFWSSRLANGGYCLVTYASQLPSRVLIRGKPSLGVLYKDRLHLFCSEACRGKFRAGFPGYSELEIHFPRTLEQLRVKNLPTRGYLEQTLAKPLARAVSRVGELRPKLPGMSSRDSAAVFIGAYLKARSGGDDAEALRRIEARCRVFRDATEAVKKKVNPWVVQKVGQGDERVVKIDDFAGKEVSKVDLFEFATVKFRRTSPTQSLIETDESSD
ncbi:adenylate kinase 9-like [Nasonia vitripennis]|uniref:Adenylate kinase 9 n=1 Tax=Nasonia vitripennis TaxID=7425 RepID=A0A7M7HIJ2_NASVI|nr:adenylate kinase 9-like [Nasonia vitripennis]